jgi:CheY-like chemotaxis protein
MNRVLIIDDDLELCELVTEFLGSEGFVCESVQEGESGLTKAANESYALVVLDVMPPGLNGNEVACTPVSGERRTKKMTGRRGSRSFRIALSLLVADVPVEEVIGLVRHKPLAPDVCLRATARRWRQPSGGVQSLNEGGLRQPIAARWSC